MFANEIVIHQIPSNQLKTFTDHHVVFNDGQKLYHAVKGHKINKNVKLLLSTCPHKIQTLPIVK